MRIPLIESISFMQARPSPKGYKQNFHPKAGIRYNLRPLLVALRQKTDSNCKQSSLNRDVDRKLTEDLSMNQDYYNAITKMEEAGVDADYICGWEGGYVLNPPREEQRVTDAYEAGYEDGKEKNADNFSSWAK